LSISLKEIHYTNLYKYLSKLFCMEDTLLSQREIFNERLNELSRIKNSGLKDSLEFQLVTSEEISEFAYRSGLIRGKIIGLGL